MKSEINHFRERNLKQKIYSKLMLSTASKIEKGKKEHLERLIGPLKVSVQSKVLKYHQPMNGDLKLSPENEEEISQILYFGYKNSLFYNKSENNRHKDFQHTD